MTANNRAVALSICAVGLLGSPCLMAAEAQSALDYGVNVKITGQSFDDQDLGTREGGDFNGAGLSLRPWVFSRKDEWSAYLMAEAFAATDVIESDDTESDIVAADDTRERDDSYLALNEFWVDYSGLTAYPGESLRLGKQKIRSPDGLWWDTNIEALRWNFSTTLLNAHVGVAERFSDYRTDLDDLAPQDEDRLHLLGDINTQWLPGHWAGLKLHHSDDSGNLPNVGDEIDSLSKTYSGQLTWIGAEVNGDFYTYRPSMPLSYWASATWLTGDVDSLRTGTAGGVRRATGASNQDVDAWALDLGLRWNIDDNWRVGTTYSRASGGGDDDSSEQFVQTDLQSNRSNFTGTNSSINRFGEAYRGELNNLQAVSLFGGWTLNKDYDASLVYHRFWRVDDQQDSASGVRAPLQPGEKDLGQEVDVVLTRYFNKGQMPQELAWLGASSALVRLRGGVFRPGDAFASGTDSSMHRAFIDVVWRY